MKELNRLKLSDLLKKDYIANLYESKAADESALPKLPAIPEVTSPPATIIDNTKDVTVNKPVEDVENQTPTGKTPPVRRSDSGGVNCDEVPTCDQFVRLAKRLCQSGQDGAFDWIRNKLCDVEECHGLQCIFADPDFNPRDCMPPGTFDCATRRENKAGLCKAMRDNFCDTGEIGLPGCSCAEPPNEYGNIGGGDCFNCLLYWKTQDGDFDTGGQGTHPKTPAEICQILHGRDSEGNPYVDDCTRDFFLAQGCGLGQYTCEYCIQQNLLRQPTEDICDCGPDNAIPPDQIVHGFNIPRDRRGVDCDEYREYVENYNRYVDEYKEWCTAYNNCKRQCWEDATEVGCFAGEPLPPGWEKPCDDYEKLPLPGGGEVGPIPDLCQDCSCNNCEWDGKSSWKPNRCYDLEYWGTDPDEMKDKANYRCEQTFPKPPVVDRPKACAPLTPYYEKALECYCKTNTIPFRDSDGNTLDACDYVGSWCPSVIFDPYESDCCRARKKMRKMVGDMGMPVWNCECGPPPASITPADFCKHMKGQPLQPNCP